MCSVRFTKHIQCQKKVTPKCIFTIEDFFLKINKFKYFLAIISDERCVSEIMCRTDPARAALQKMKNTLGNKSLPLNKKREGGERMGEGERQRQYISN